MRGLEIGQRGVHSLAYFLGKSLKKDILMLKNLASCSQWLPPHSLGPDYVRRSAGLPPRLGVVLLYAIGEKRRPRYIWSVMCRFRFQLSTAAALALRFQHASNHSPDLRWGCRPRTNCPRYSCRTAR